MKVYFREDGALVIQAEDNTEQVALRAWHDANGVRVVDWDSYLEAERESEDVFGFFKEENKKP